MSKIYEIYMHADDACAMFMAHGKPDGCETMRFISMTHTLAKGFWRVRYAVATRAEYGAGDESAGWQELINKYKALGIQPQEVAGE